MVQDEDEEAGTRIYTAALGRPGRVITGASSPNSSQPFRYNSELGRLSIFSFDANNY